MNIVSLPEEVPLRVDLAGGWLDVPKHARLGAFVVNCAINTMVSLTRWPYEREGGLGGSAAWCALNCRNPVQIEMARGVGWQDPAVIAETGLCVWHSGERPRLAFKSDGAFINGKLAIQFIVSRGDTSKAVDYARDYDAIGRAGKCAADAVRQEDPEMLMEAINRSYEIQTLEGMAPLAIPLGAVGKYCGKGFGGYAVYLFQNPRLRAQAICDTDGLIEVEPYLKSVWN